MRACHAACRPWLRSLRAAQCGATTRQRAQPPAAPRTPAIAAAAATTAATTTALGVRVVLMPRGAPPRGKRAHPVPLRTMARQRPAAGGCFTATLACLDCSLLLCNCPLVAAVGIVGCCCRWRWLPLSAVAVGGCCCCLPPPPPPLPPLLVLVAAAVVLPAAATSYSLLLPCCCCCCCSCKAGATTEGLGPGKRAYAASARTPSWSGTIQSINDYDAWLQGWCVGCGENCVNKVVPTLYFQTCLPPLSSRWRVRRYTTRRQHFDMEF